MLTRDQYTVYAHTEPSPYLWESFAEFGSSGVEVAVLRFKKNSNMLDLNIWPNFDLHATLNLSFLLCFGCVRMRFECHHARLATRVRQLVLEIEGV